MIFDTSLLLHHFPIFNHTGFISYFVEIHTACKLFFHGSFVLVNIREYKSTDSFWNIVIIYWRTISLRLLCVASVKLRVIFFVTQSTSEKAQRTTEPTSKYHMPVKHSDTQKR